MTDRSSIDVALARRLVDRQFPQWSALPVAEVEVDGWDNRTFRLGSELTVRLPSGDWYAKQVDKDKRLYAVRGGKLMYAMEMAAVGQPLAPHLSAALDRVE